MSQSSDETNAAEHEQHSESYSSYSVEIRVSLARTQEPRWLRIGKRLCFTIPVSLILVGLCNHLVGQVSGYPLSPLGYLVAGAVTIATAVLLALVAELRSSILD